MLIYTHTTRRWPSCAQSAPKKSCTAAEADVSGLDWEPRVGDNGRWNCFPFRYVIRLCKVKCVGIGPSIHSFSFGTWKRPAAFSLFSSWRSQQVKKIPSAEYGDETWYNRIMVLVLPLEWKKSTRREEKDSSWLQTQRIGASITRRLNTTETLTDDGRQLFHWTARFPSVFTTRRGP